MDVKKLMFQFLGMVLIVTAISCAGSGSNGSSGGGAKESISGTVTGAVQAGVTMTLTISGVAKGTTTTDASGNYSFTGLAKGAYTVTPSLASYAFTPEHTPVTISSANVSAINFVDTSGTSYSISGNRERRG